MAFDRTTPEDAAALSEGRARMRALAGRICDAVEAMPLPETFYEGERAARTIHFADRLLERLPGGRRSAEGVVSPARQRLRVFAETVVSVIENLDMPETFRDGERALRCVAATEKLYEQFYAPPKRSRLTADEFEDEFEDKAEDDNPEATAIRVFERIDHMSLSYARDCGFYPDGSRLDPAVPVEPKRLCCPEEERLMTAWITNTAAHPYPPEESARQLAQIMTARFNAVARAQAKHTGKWPDGRAFNETDRDFFAISKVYPITDRSGPVGRAADEAEGARGFPWWVVRAPDTG
jgi:hypothetical protein